MTNGSVETDSPRHWPFETGHLLSSESSLQCHQEEFYTAPRNSSRLICVTVFVLLLLRHSGTNIALKMGLLKDVAVTFSESSRI